jgi:hypothetical protein
MLQKYLLMRVLSVKCCRPYSDRITWYASVLQRLLTEMHTLVYILTTLGVS